MAYVPTVVQGTWPSEHGPGEPMVPVILDHGDHARVAAVAFGRSPQVGDRFDIDGVIWEVTRVRDLQRGYVARPVRAGACVH
jgi:hypothetical protein